VRVKFWSRFKVSDTDMYFISAFRDAVDDAARYNYNPTDENLDKKLVSADLCIKKLFQINKNKDLITRYQILMDSNITDREQIWSSLYQMSKDLMNETGLVYKLIPIMIMTNVESLVKGFAIYMLINVLVVAAISFGLYYSTGYYPSYSVPALLVFAILFYLPTKIFELKSLYQSIQLYREIYR